MDYFLRLGVGCGCGGESWGGMRRASTCFATWKRVGWNSNRYPPSCLDSSNSHRFVDGNAPRCCEVIPRKALTHPGSRSGWVDGWMGGWLWLSQEADERAGMEDIFESNELSLQLRGSE